MTIKSNTERLAAAMEATDTSLMIELAEDHLAVDGWFQRGDFDTQIDKHLAPLSSIITVGNPRAMYLRTVWADGTTDDGREFEVSQVGVNLVITIGTMEDGDKREVYEIRLHDLMPAFLRTVGAVKRLGEDEDPEREERECSRCGDEVLILNSRDECASCEEARDKGDVCSRCDEDVDWDPALGAYRENGVTICGSCSHNERRS